MASGWGISLTFPHGKRRDGGHVRATAKLRTLGRISRLARHGWLVFVVGVLGKTQPVPIICLSRYNPCGDCGGQRNKCVGWVGYHAHAHATSLAPRFFSIPWLRSTGYSVCMCHPFACMTRQVFFLILRTQYLHLIYPTLLVVILMNDWYIHHRVAFLMNRLNEES